MSVTEASLPIRASMGVPISVAVTGGIGAGKSTVSAMLADRGAVIIDSDQLAREVVGVGTPGLASVAREFGPEVLAADGTLDRPALAAVVFADPAARRRLEAITHPMVRARFEELRAAAPDDAIVVNDIPLIRSVTAAAQFILVIGVHAPLEIRLDRLTARGMTNDDATARIKAQLSDAERAPLCDIWLPNGGDLMGITTAVDRLWSGRLQPLGANIRAGLQAPRGPLLLVDPDPAWNDQAQLLAARIRAATGDARVDHIGSTAVPGLPAEDVIDLQIAVPNLAAAGAFAEPLRQKGFPAIHEIITDTPHQPDSNPESWRKRLHGNADPGRAVNLHLRVQGSPGWRWALLFRDWLRAEPVVQEKYLQMKRAAVTRTGGAGSRAYADGKEPWFGQAYPEGLAWAAATSWQPDAQE